MGDLEGLLLQGAEQLSVALSSKQLEKFTIYLSLIEVWNKRINLVGPATRQAIIVTHFLDALSCLKSEKLENGWLVIDVGSGAGLPGIPIKIARPALRMTLLDSVRKKTDFLNLVIQELKLENVRVNWGRAEDEARKVAEREAYDIALARAVAPLSTLLEYVLPFVKVGGYFIAQRGSRASQDVAEAEGALRMLGGRAEKIIPVEVPFLEAKRHLVLIVKQQGTLEKYPRRAGIPRKKPLKSGFG